MSTRSAIYWLKVNMVWLGSAVLLAACSPARPAVPGTPDATPPPEHTPLPFEEGSAVAPSDTSREGPSADDTALEFMPTLTRLADPGCCMGVVWSATGDEVLFIDQPQPDMPTGLYGVSVDGGSARLVSEQVGLFSPDGQYWVTVNTQSQPVIKDLESGEINVIRNRGRQPVFSPHSQYIAWNQIQDAQVFSNRRATISVANVDGTGIHEVATVAGGGLAGWLDDEHLLIYGREPGEPEGNESLFSLSIADGERVELARSPEVRNVLPSPGGQWVFYAIALDPDQPEQNGLWVVSADGRQRHELDVVGSAQWRDANRLLIIPLEMDAPSHRLVQYNAPRDETAPLTDPAHFPFRVLAGEWRVSPTGEHVAFVSADDQALWVFDLPPGELPESLE